MHIGPVMESEIQAGVYRDRSTGGGGTVESEAFDEVFGRTSRVEVLGLDGLWLGEHHFTLPK